MSDKYEPYLEPLFIPGVLGLSMLFINFLDNIYRSADVVSTPVLLAFFVVGFLFLLSSILVFVYEILLLTSVIKARVFIKKQTKFYSFVRWVLAGIGLVSMLFAGYITLMLIVTGIVLSSLAT